MSLRQNQRTRLFVKCAKALLNLIENPKFEKRWARDVLVELSATYAAGNALPVVATSRPEPEPDETYKVPEYSPSPLDVSNEERTKNYHRLTELLGQFNFYQTYFEVMEPLELVGRGDKQELVVGSVADGLADIHRDVKSGLNAWETGQEELMQEAVWQWKFTLESHWGHHAVDIMRALNELVYSSKWPDDDSIDQYFSSRV
jgi:hypothetical protein